MLVVLFYTCIYLYMDLFKKQRADCRWKYSTTGKLAMFKVFGLDPCSVSTVSRGMFILFSESCFPICSECTVSWAILRSVSLSI